MTGVGLSSVLRCVLEAEWLRHRLQEVSSLLLLSGIPPPPNHHPGLLERIVTKPQLPNDASVVAVALRIRKILPVQVGFKAARKWKAVTTLNYAKVPVEPPSSTIGRSTRTTFRSKVIISVHCGELVSVVSWKTVTSVTGVASDPNAIVIILIVNPGNVFFDSWWSCPRTHLNCEYSAQAVLPSCAVSSTLRLAPEVLVSLWM